VGAYNPSQKYARATEKVASDVKETLGELKNRYFSG
jgi:hypothetical protein